MIANGAPPKEDPVEDNENELEDEEEAPAPPSLTEILRPSSDLRYLLGGSSYSSSRAHTSLMPLDSLDTLRELEAIGGRVERDIVSEEGGLD